MKLQKIFAAALTTVTLFSAGSALAAGDGINFKVDEYGLIGNPGTQFDADSANFHFTSDTNRVGTSGFNQTGHLDLTSFLLDNNPLSGLGLNQGTGGYTIYGDFTSSGTSSMIGSIFSATFDIFSLDLYVDYNGSQVHLGSASIAGAQTGEMLVGSTGGFFDVLLNFTATTEGEQFFTSMASWDSFTAQ